MVPYHLITQFIEPLEREYEAWIVRCIEDYASRTGSRCSTFAVPPGIESQSFAADEAIGFRSKFFGLQFKRANLSAPASGNQSPEIWWEIHPSSKQFGDILVDKRIYYCLPTFINRDLRYEALHHTLFWRPCLCHEKPSGFHHLNDARQYRRHLCGPQLRWGDFIEGVLECDIGQVVEQGTTLTSLLSSNIISDKVTRERQFDRRDDGYTYYVAIELKALGT